MKKALTPLLLLLAACSRKEAAPTPSTPEHSVSWAVDGTAVTTPLWVSGTNPGRTATMLVYGREYANDRLASEVRLEAPAAVGTYSLGTASTAWASYQSASNGATYYAGAAPVAVTGSTGTLAVSEVANRQAAGTFTFTAVDPTTGATKVVTAGRFRVPL